ncbi:MAG: hypothetical protein ACE5EA_07215, partial [Nitrospirota bacterium]
MPARQKPCRTALVCYRISTKPAILSEEKRRFVAGFIRDTFLPILYMSQTDMRHILVFCSKIPVKLVTIQLMQSKGFQRLYNAY